jgi:hypothetical protein
LSVSVHARAGARQGDQSGFVTLTRGTVTRRIPFWFGVTVPQLRRDPYRTLRKPGVYRADTRRGHAHVSTYRYPADPSSLGLYATLPGPEQVFRFRVTRPVANAGAALVAHQPGAVLEPRIVAAGDENRLAGITALPLTSNPYLATFEVYRPVVAVIRPRRGTYDIVVDSASRADAGKFALRFWIDDVAPPTIRLAARRARGGRIVAIVADRGSGVDPRSIVAKVDGRGRPVAYSAARSRATIRVGGLSRGTHRLVLRAADYQELKNMENVPRILPNTREIATTFVVP